MYLYAIMLLLCIMVFSFADFLTASADMRTSLLNRRPSERCSHDGGRRNFRANNRARVFTFLVAANSPSYVKTFTSLYKYL